MKTQLSILTPTIPGREKQLLELTEKIQKQIGDLPVEHLSLCDNRKRSIGAKRQSLVDIAQGKYIAFCDDDDDISDDYVEETLPVKVVAKPRGPRASVSAEAFGKWNQKGAFVAKVIPKSGEVKAALRKKLDMAFMFSALDEKEKDVVIDAMAEVKVDINDVVIKEGDQGDCLYIVD